jgi:hypothetical protein
MSEAETMRMVAKIVDETTGPMRQMPRCGSTSTDSRSRRAGVGRTFHPFPPKPLVGLRNRSSPPAREAFRGGQYPAM